MSDALISDLMAAHAAMDDTWHLPIEYRVVFDPITRICVQKTTSITQEPHVLVSKEDYDLVEICDHFYVTKSGKLMQRHLDSGACILLSLTDSNGIRTLPNCISFVVGDEYSGATDQWTLKDTYGTDTDS